MELLPIIIQLLLAITNNEERSRGSCSVTPEPGQICQWQ